LLNDVEYEPLPAITTIPFSCCAVFIGGGELMRLLTSLPHAQHPAAHDRQTTHSLKARDTRARSFPVNVKCPAEAGHFHKCGNGMRIEGRSTFRASRKQTVSPWSQRVVELDTCRPETCRSGPYQRTEQAPEVAAPCEVDRQQRQHSASQRMRPLRSESSA
jgi:hypothetical protein